MSNFIENVLYLGENISLVNTLLHSLNEKKDNYQVFHLVSEEQLYLTLSENSVSHLISEWPLNSDLKDKIKADFPLLKTTYLAADDHSQEIGLSFEPEHIFTDEVQVVLESLSIPIYFKNKYGQYLACNRHFSALFNLSPDQVIGKKLADISVSSLIDLSGSPLIDDIDKINKKIFIDHQVVLDEYPWTDKAG
ncbi:GGDEF domain-containing protein, partial [Psychromonas sp. MB-3u-54]|uniref:PAS domain-containing protein n=1 Tax=Psychromonas sp. MB-3u-54 TaxID=2058319 RepID=UPI000CA8F804